MIKPLLVFSNAYDCKPVIDELKNIPCDQLHINYFSYPYNYTIGENFFLENDYSHYIPIAPDLVLTKEQFLFLSKEVEKNPNDVYGPCCNVDTAKYKDRLAFCLRLPLLEYLNRRYYWSSEGFRQAAITNGVNVIDVKFNALAAPFIPRKIKEKCRFTKTPYKTDERPIWEKRGGYACDLAFCHYCDYLKIPIKVDLRIKCLHLRYGGTLQVGIKEPSVIFYKWDGEKHVKKQIRVQQNK